MAPNDKLDFTLDAGDSIKVANSLSKAFETQGQRIKELVSITNRYNSAGEKMDATVKGITKSGKEFTAVLESTNKGLKTTAIRFTEVAGAANKARLSLEQQSRAASKNVTPEAMRNAERATARYVQTVIKGAQDVDKATAKEKRGFANVAGELNNLLQKTGASQLGLAKIFKAVQQGNLDVFSGAQREAAVILQRLQDYGSALGSTYRKEQQVNAQRNAASRAQLEQIEQVQYAQRLLRDAFQVPTGLSITGKSKIESEIRRIIQLVEQGKLSVTTLQTVLSAPLNAGSFSGAAGQVQSALQRIRQQMAAVDDESKKVTTSINLSWTSVARILVAGLVRNALFETLQALRASVQTAIDFQKQISGIRTISQDNQRSFKEWARSVRDLSDQFGSPLLDVAKANYEAISNQIGQGARSTQFLTEALNFGLATFSSSADSVNLLSSVLNAYNLTTEEAGRVSASLFRTIDLGRLTANELANSYGRVAVPANALGVSLEELNALTAVLTINGVSTSEALTQISGILTKLTKPTTEMSELFRELGVANGQVAISSLGFVGTLRAIQERANSGSEALAELFNEVRGLRGALEIVGSPEGLANYEEVLSKIVDSQKAFSTALDISRESAGFAISREFEQLRNFFAVDLQQAIQESVVSLATVSEGQGKVAGDSVVLAERIQSLVEVIIDLSKALALPLGVAALTKLAVLSGTLLKQMLATIAATGLLGTKMQVAAAQSGILLSTIQKINLAVGALLIAWTAVEFAQERATRRLISIAEDYEREQTFLANTTALERNRIIAEEINAEVSKVARLEKINLDYLRNRQQQYQEASRQISFLEKDITRTVNDEFKRRLDLFEQYIDSFRRQADRLRSENESINEQLSNLAKTREERQFEQSQSLRSPEQQIEAGVERIDSLNQDRLNAEASGNLARALEIQLEIEELYNQLRSVALGIGKSFTDRDGQISTRAKEQLDRLVDAEALLKNTERLLQSRKEENTKTLEDLTKVTDSFVGLQEQLISIAEKVKDIKFDASEPEKFDQQLAQIRSSFEEFTKVVNSGNTEISKFFATQVSGLDAQFAKLAEAKTLLEDKINLGATPEEITEAQVTVDAIQKSIQDSITAAGTELQELAKLKDKIVSEQDASGQQSFLLGNIEPRVVELRNLIQSSLDQKKFTIALEISGLELQAESATALQQELVNVSNAITNSIREARGQQSAARTDLDNSTTTLIGSLKENSAIIAKIIELQRGVVEDQQLAAPPGQPLPPIANQDAADLALLESLQRRLLVARSLAEQSLAQTGTLSPEALAAIEEFNTKLAQSKNLLVGLNDNSIVDFFNKTPKLFDELKTNTNNSAEALLKYVEASESLLQSEALIDANSKKVEQLDKFTEKLTGTKESDAEFTLEIHDPLIEGTTNLLNTQKISVDQLAASYRKLTAAKGGQVTPAPEGEGFATGGRAQGSDTVPAMLTPGEFVVRASQADRHLDLLKKINAGRYALGGPVKRGKTLKKASTIERAAELEGLDARGRNTKDFDESKSEVSFRFISYLRNFIERPLSRILDTAFPNIRKTRPFGILELIDPLLPFVADYYPDAFLKQGLVEDGITRPGPNEGLPKFGMSPALVQIIAKAIGGELRSNNITSKNWEARLPQFFKRWDIIPFEAPLGFASGGRVTGTDTVPAMLTPGEFVLNKQAAQAFTPYIQQLNAGRRPDAPASGGTYYLDLTINEAEIPNARALVDELNRGIRTGKFKLGV